MKVWQIWLSIFVSLIVIGYMMIAELDVSVLTHMQLTWRFFTGIAIAILLFCLQNLMMTLRFWLLTKKELPLAKCFRVNIMCEFTSAVTPSSVGGSGFTFLFLKNEGIAMGKATFTMFAALLSDEVFLSVSSLLVLIFVPSLQLYGPDSTLKDSIRYIFIGSTVVVFIWSIILYVLIFIKPQWIGRFVKFICRLPFLKRFHKKAIKFSDDLTIASNEAKGNKPSFWVKLMLTSAGAWMSRFGIVAAIIGAFSTDKSLLVAWVRQWLLWMVSVISPTPGGSGVAEMMFRIYYNEYFANTSMIIVATIIWRIIFYYSFLILGAIIIPGAFKKSNARATLIDSNRGRAERLAKAE